MLALRRSLLALVLLTVHLLAVSSFAQSASVPKQYDYVNDFAKHLDSSSREELNRRLDKLERETSNQIMIAIFPALPEREELASYSIRVGNEWKVGQKEQSNGALLCIYVRDQKIFIASGYGLEGALPDATCRLIIENDIKPKFLANDFKGGINAGLDAIIAATKGEYKGTGSTSSSRTPQTRLHDWWWVFLIAFLIFLVMLLMRAFSPEYTTYSRHGRFSGGWWFSLVMGALGDTLMLVIQIAASSKGGGSSDSRSSGSGGGGRFGGGGAGGSW